MASARQQKPCVGCQNGVVTCTGCEKRFCLPHLNEHRQMLDKRMDEVVHEHNQLREALNPQGSAPHLLSRIDEWEQASIRQIKDTAKQVRADLEACFDRTKHRLTNLLGNMAEQLKSSQTSNVYTEKELDGWMRQLEQLRQKLEKPLNIDIVENDATRSSICMIKMIERSNSEEHSTANKMAAPPRIPTVEVST
ncbi:unnamed protein product, partial [Rotaria sp. Silwood2]